MTTKFNKKGWKEYYDAQGKLPAARPLLLRVLKRLPKNQSNLRSVDLGCGRGGDTFELLKRGHRVIAIDAQPEAIRLLKRSIPKKYAKRLKPIVRRFEELRLRELKAINLINASYSLFFIRPSQFGRVWGMLVKCMEPGGVMCGQLLGKRDSWAFKRGMTSTKKSELKKLFKGFDLIYFNEEDYDGKTLVGRQKHWHVYSFIVKKHD